MTDPDPQRLPAEWEPQSGVLLTWPHGRGDWAGMLNVVEPVFTHLAVEIARRERVLIACLDDKHYRHVQALLHAADVEKSRLDLRITPSNDTWTRDHGPITVVRDGQPVLKDFVFNGWGNKYDAALDNQLTRRLHAAGAFGATPLETVELVLEGGAIDSDGAGTLLTTSRCLLNPNRNGRLTRAAMARKLRSLLGVSRVLWLNHGHLEGDDTDGHVDTLARFCSADTIAYVHCDDPADAHRPELAAMEAELKALRTGNGKPYRLVPLPLPEAKFDTHGARLPATYANFLIINQAVLVPTYADPADAVALARLGEAFPEREIVAVPCLPLIHQYGSLHCVTMQLPAGVLQA